MIARNEMTKKITLQKTLIKRESKAKAETQIDHSHLKMKEKKQKQICKYISSILELVSEKQGRRIR